MAVVFLGFEGGILTFNRTYVLCGLMALLFYSSRHGYDDAAYSNRRDERIEP